MKEVLATVSSEIVLRDLSIRSIERLRFALSYPHPEYIQALRMGRRGIVPDVPLRFECMTEWPDGSITVPRGAVEVVRSALAADELRLEFGDRRSVGLPIVLPRKPDGRSYQLDGVTHLERKAQGMIVLPPGGGKTRLGVMAIARIGRTSVVCVHTDDLLDQWVETIREHLGIEPGVVNADRKEWGADAVVASVFTFAPMLEEDPTIGERFGLVILDECFPAGTIVDGVPVEKIRVGDEVSSFDAHGVVSLKKVLHVFVRHPSALIRLHMSDGGELVCTPNHRLWSSTGWIEASDSLGTEVYVDQERRSEAMRGLRHTGQAADRQVLRRLPEGEARSQSEAGHCTLRRVQQTGDLFREIWARSGKDRARILLARAQVRVEEKVEFRDHVEDQHGTCLGTNEGSQSNAPGIDETKGVRNAGGYRPQTADPRRKRSGADGPAETTAGSIRERLGSGIRSQDQPGARISSPPQDRPSSRVNDDSRRGGRWIALFAEETRTGHEKRGFSHAVRVDRVEVLQPGSDGTYGGVCPSGLVFDLEVEDNHTYFANGVAVHNCHHTPAKTIQRILRHLPAKWRLGLSATPEREDGHTKLVDWSFGPRLLVKTVPELVADGFLMMPRLVEVPTSFEYEMSATDPRRITKLHRALVADAARNQLIVDLAMWEVQAGETVLLLSNRKPHCRKLGKMLVALGIDARVVVGTTKKSDRKGDLSDLRSGAAPIVIATSLADEGLNVERLSRIILAFPEKARGKTIQRVGRLTRLWSGKDPVIFDVVDPLVETLVRRAGERKRAYRSIGMDA